MNLKQELDTVMQNFTNTRVTHWNSVATTGRGTNDCMRRQYQDFLQKLYACHITIDARVLEIGCAEGDLLAAVAPRNGVGIDFSEQMIDKAREAHPQLTFVHANALDVKKSDAVEFLSDPFDVIILSDIVGDVWDVALLLENLKQFCTEDTRIFFNFHSHLYGGVSGLLRKSGLMTKRLQQSWLTPNDLSNMLSLAGFETVRLSHEFLFPFKIPFIATLFNRYLAKIWPFSMFCLTHFCVARLLAKRKEMSVSVIVPACNEAGNIENVLQRTPAMGSETEFIFVEGNSTDNTWDTIIAMKEKYAHKKITILQQPDKGKGDAVRAGLAVANNDILMILNADLSTPPESLPQFYEAIASGKTEFANGVRLVYPQKNKDMRVCSFAINKLFGITLSWLLGFAIKDTLCATKAIKRKNYLKFMDRQGYFGNFDTSGNLDLLFGAVKMNLKFSDIPIHYCGSNYGKTGISRWKRGWILLKVVCFAADKIKFIPNV